MALSVTDFAAKIKSKYPDYASVGDYELVNKIIAKYPEYASQVDLNTQPIQSNEQQSDPGLLDNVMNSGFVKGVNNLANIPGNIVKATSEAYQNAVKGPTDNLGNPVQRSTVGKIIDSASGALDVAAAPLLATANTVTNSVNDISGGALNSLSDNALMSGLPLDKAKQVLDNVKSKIGDEAYYNLAGLSNIAASVVPGGVGTKAEINLAGKAVEGAAKSTAKALAATSDRFLSGELKIKQSLAKSAYGGSIPEKKQGIINTIKDYDLISPTGNFESASTKAQDAISGLETSRVSTYEKYPDIPKDPKVISNPVQILKQSEKLSDPATKGSAAWGKSAQAKAIIDGIVKDATDAGFDKPSTLAQIMQVRERLNPDGELFKNGAFLSQNDNLDIKIRKSMYFDLLDEAEKIAPELRTIGREEKKLIDTKAIIDDARSRISNKNPISFSDWATLWGGRAAALGGTVAGAHYAGVSDPVSIVGAMTAYGLKKAGEQGRAASVLNNASKAAKKVANLADNLK